GVLLDAASAVDAPAMADAALAIGDGAAPGQGDGSTAASTCPPGAGYAFCSGFEGSLSETTFKLKAGQAIETGNAAHGRSALHLTNLKPHSGQMVGGPLGNIKDVMWGRFYFYLDAGAPQGHSAFIYAGDAAGAVWEMGFIFHQFMVDYHINGEA